MKLWKDLMRLEVQSEKDGMVAFSKRPWRHLFAVLIVYGATGLSIFVALKLYRII